MDFKNLEEIVLNPEKMVELMKIVRFIDADEFFVKNSLKLRRKLFLSFFTSRVSSFLQAEILFNGSKDGSEEEKFYLREMIKFAPEEENKEDLLLGIYEDADDCEDKEAMMLVIRAIAKLL